MSSRGLKFKTKIKRLPLKLMRVDKIPSVRSIQEEAEGHKNQEDRKRDHPSSPHSIQELNVIIMKTQKTGHLECSVTFIKARVA